MMNNDEQLAYKLAMAIKDAPNGIFTSNVIDTANKVLATKTPTMGDVKWDDDEHYLAEVELENSGLRFAMVERDGDYIVCVTDTNVRSILASSLWLTGNRYKLMKTTNETEHPEVLITEEDYKNAPLGTIVANKGFSPHMKCAPNVWEDTFSRRCYDKGMEGGSRKVLRYGKWGC